MSQDPSRSHHGESDAPLPPEVRSLQRRFDALAERMDIVEPGQEEALKIAQKALDYIESPPHQIVHRTNRIEGSLDTLQKTAMARQNEPPPPSGVVGVVREGATQGRAWLKEVTVWQFLGGVVILLLVAFIIVALRWDGTGVIVQFGGKTVDTQEVQNQNVRGQRIGDQTIQDQEINVGQPDRGAAPVQIQDEDY